MTPPKHNVADSTSRLKQVLVVDDDADLRLYVQRRLSHLYVVSEAATGLEALEMTQSWKPDIILLDLGLPDMNGLVLLSEFRAIPRLRQTPIVLMTGGALDQSTLETLHEHTTVFPKPFGGKSLLSCISQFLGEHKTASS